MPNEERRRAAIRPHFATGPCVLCGPKWAAAHRLVDAIRARRHDESISSIAIDYELPEAVVSYIARAPIRKLDWLRRIK